jgi:putative nucleotidyltransferase with HDIG domain
VTGTWAYLRPFGELWHTTCFVTGITETSSSNFLTNSGTHQLREERTKFEIKIGRTEMLQSKGVLMEIPDAPPSGEFHVLVVDDEPLIRESLAEFLQSRGFFCETAASGKDALGVLQSRSFELVITDMRMPDLNGLQLLEHLTHKDPDAAIIMITGVNEVDTAVHAMKKGAADYITKPFDLDKVSSSITRALHLRRLRLDNKKNTQSLEVIVRKKSSALNMALENIKEHDDIILDVLAKALDARGHETHSHSKRVQAYTVRLAQQFGIRSKRMEDLSRGALLHDIGKIGISDTILLKPGTLEPDEQMKMRRHPIIGSQILQGVKFLDQVSKMVLHHHERYDGLGYPMGLKAEEIPIEARLFAVMDTYDAMTSDRPYRKALSPEIARREITSKAGSQFDPDAVREFLKIPQLEWDKISAKFR